EAPSRRTPQLRSSCLPPQHQAGEPASHSGGEIKEIFVPISMCSVLRKMRDDCAIFSFSPPMQCSTRQHLIGRVRVMGNSPCKSDVVRLLMEHRDSLFAYILAVTRDFDIAEEVFQETS